MILPVVAYGHPVLRQVCVDITTDYPNLDILIADMWETMYNSHGMGIAAPQINKAVRLFVIDTEQVYSNSDEDEREQFEGEQGLKKVFINAHISERSGHEWSCDEGCLSLPGFREEVSRENIITVSYCDENFVQKTETFRGLNARVIQHEYDHIEGKLFIDRISLIKRKLLKKKLDDISAGRVKPGYKMLFAK
ncbi:MAG: peptide deformylase [Bacteroidota bacterium]|jgi:peptide deformylase